MPLYFAYGSNMSVSRIQARLGEVTPVGRAMLPGYRHAFDKPGFDGTAKGNIVLATEDACVHGVLYRLHAEQLLRLREYEGGYRLIDVIVHREQERWGAVSFEALAPTPGLRPSREYLAHYERGMREHELPEDYVRDVLGVLLTTEA